MYRLPSVKSSGESSSSAPERDPLEAFGWGVLPHEEGNKSVIFLPHVLRGLGFPVSNFFRGLLHHWGVQVHHLTPNSILHISIFVRLCEAFLGIEPHFDLFQYFFHLKPHPNDSNIDVVGGLGFSSVRGRNPSISLTN